MFSQYSKPNLFGSGVHRLQRYTLETNWQGPLDLEFYCFVRHFLFSVYFSIYFPCRRTGQNCKNLASFSFWQKSQAPNGAIFKKKTATQPSILFSHTQNSPQIFFRMFWWYIMRKFVQLLTLLQKSGLSLEVQNG